MQTPLPDGAKLEDLTSAIAFKEDIVGAPPATSADRTLPVTAHSCAASGPDLTGPAHFACPPRVGFTGCARAPPAGR